MKKIKGLGIAIALCGIIGCSSTTPYQTSMMTGAIGAATGTLIDKNNKWRGAAIGATVGGLIGGISSEMAAKASREAALSKKTVVVRDGNSVFESVPLDTNQQTKCTKVRERVYHDNQVVKDTVKEICQGTKIEGTY